MLNPIVRQVPKRQFQAMLHVCRGAGAHVEKDSGGFYRVWVGDTLVLAAVPGRRDYLVRMQADLFQQ